METEVDKVFDLTAVTDQAILDASESFIGEIEQYPPIFSAVRKDGKRLYEYARSGQEVEIKPRKIEIHEIEILSIDLPKVDFRVKCSKGTYIRSLANDLGVKLGCGAYLSALRRTKIGEYNVNNALHPKKFGALLAKDGDEN